jgi:hypothetical protein
MDPNKQEKNMIILIIIPWRYCIVGVLEKIMMAIGELVQNFQRKTI